MPVNLSVETVPDDVVERLRMRAVHNHRSLQDELMAIIEAAAGTPKSLSPDEVLAEVRRLDVSTPSESSAMVRADRDGR